MRFRFASSKLLDLYQEEKGAHRYPSSVVAAFFEVMDVIDSAADERDLYALRSLRYEKLKGDRSGQYSMRLNRQFRLVLERVRDEEGLYLLITDIEDYH